MPELAFVLGSDAEPSLVGLAEALAAEVSNQDALAKVTDVLPDPRPDRVLVAFDEPLALGASSAELSRTIVVVTVPPGVVRFDAVAAQALHAGMSFHVNSAAVSALHLAGVPARHLQLGHSPHWAVDGRGIEDLAVITGDGYFDWVEALSAIHRGAVVLHERCLGMAPMVAGRHLFVAAPDSMALLAEILRERPERLVAVRGEVSAFVEEALPLSLAASALIGAARAVAAQAPAASRKVAHPAA